MVGNKSCERKYTRYMIERCGWGDFCEWVSQGRFLRRGDLFAETLGVRWEPPKSLGKEHCRKGKKRTQVGIISWLLMCQPSLALTDALSFYQHFNKNFLLMNDCLQCIEIYIIHMCPFLNNAHLRAGKDLEDKVVHTLILQMWKLNPRKATRSADYHTTSL